MTCASILRRRAYRKARLKANPEKAWHKRNPEKAKAYHKLWYKANSHKFREYNLRRNFGISESEYQILLKRQNGTCVFCSRTTSAKGRRLAVDHDHITGKVRGLLCGPHNRAIGMLGDTIEGIQKVLDYLKGT